MSIGQKYGELAQVFRTGEAFEYDVPIRPAVSGVVDTDSVVITGSKITSYTRYPLQVALCSPITKR